MSGVDYAQKVLFQEDSDSEDLFKINVNIALMLNYKVFNYWVEGLKCFIWYFPS